MFSFNRFTEQFKILLRQNAQKQGLYLLAYILLCVFSIALSFYTERNELVLNFKFWGFVVAIMTIVNALGVFAPLLRTESSIQYSMTPANISEKYAAAWLYSSLFTIGLYSVVILLTQWISIQVGSLFTQYSMPSILPDKKSFQDGITGMMYLHSLFFLGAVIFRKNPFGKTLLSLLLFQITLGLLASAVIGILLRYTNWLDKDMILNSNTNITWHFDVSGRILKTFPPELEYLSYIIKGVATCIPFICWGAAYYRLKTREV